MAASRGVRAFVIGGYVRDCFLGRECNDIDVVVEGSGIDFARAVGEKTGMIYDCICLFRVVDANGRISARQ